MFDNDLFEYALIDYEPKSEFNEDEELTDELIEEGFIEFKIKKSGKVKKKDGIDPVTILYDFLDDIQDRELERLMARNAKK